MKIEHLLTYLHTYILDYKISLLLVTCIYYFVYLLFLFIIMIRCNYSQYMN